MIILLSTSFSSECLTCTAVSVPVPRGYSVKLRGGPRGGHGGVGLLRVRMRNCKACGVWGFRHYMGSREPKSACRLTVWGRGLRMGLRNMTEGLTSLLREEPPEQVQWSGGVILPDLDGREG